MATMDERGEFDRKSSYLHAIVSRRAAALKLTAAPPTTTTLQSALLTIAAASAAFCMGIIKSF